MAGQDSREFTFSKWNDRACRFSNGLKDLGVGYKDSFAVLAYNRGEWMDIFAGCAKGGQVVVPVMFRLAGPEIEYIVNHAECKGMIVEAPFVDLINGIRDRLQVPAGGFVYLGEGPVPDGYVGYETLISESSPNESRAAHLRGRCVEHHVHLRDHGTPQGGGADP